MREGVGLTRGQNAVNMLDHFVAVEGMAPVGEIRIVPDPDTYTRLDWLPRTAGLLCDQLDHDWTDWGSCTRSFLKRAIDAAAAAGIRVMASFENEFYLAEEVDGVVRPYGDGPVYSSAGMDRVAYVMDDIVSALETQGLEVEQAINESGRPAGVASATPTPRAADNQLKFRDAVRGGQVGTISRPSPPPFAGASLGPHVHFSLWSMTARATPPRSGGGRSAAVETGRSSSPGPRSPARARGLTCPSFNSYERLRPQAWAGATVSWGLDNRECAVRVASPFRGREMESTNVELKACDPSCNPYLALGGLILAGLDGVKRRLEPPDPATKDPARMSDEELERSGIAPLPSSFAGGAGESSGGPRALPGARRPARAVHRGRPDRGDRGARGDVARRGAARAPQGVLMGPCQGAVPEAGSGRRYR
jgi:glutamine synthetase